MAENNAESEKKFDYTKLPYELKHMISKSRNSRADQRVLSISVGDSRVKTLDALSKFYVDHLARGGSHSFDILIEYIRTASAKSERFWKEKQPLPRSFDAKKVLVVSLFNGLNARNSNVFYNCVQLFKALAIANKTHDKENAEAKKRKEDLQARQERHEKAKFSIATPRLSVTGKLIIQVRGYTSTYNDLPHNFIASSVIIEIDFETRNLLGIHIDSQKDILNFKSLGELHWKPENAQKIHDMKSYQQLWACALTAKSNYVAGRAPLLIDGNEYINAIDTFLYEIDLREGTFETRARNRRVSTPHVEYRSLRGAQNSSEIDYIIGIVVFMLDIGIPFQIEHIVLASSFVDRIF